MSLRGSSKNCLAPAFLAAFALMLSLASGAGADAAFPDSTFVQIGELALPDAPFSFAITEVRWTRRSTFLVGPIMRESRHALCAATP